MDLALQADTSHTCLLNTTAFTFKVLLLARDATHQAVHVGVSALQIRVQEYKTR